MKNFLYGLLIASLLFGGVAYAQSNKQALEPTFVLVDGSEIYGRVWGLDYGWIVKFDDSDGFYTCGCYTDACQIPQGETPTPPDETPMPPTETPPTPPTEEPREHCNRGIGNDSEGCDPGNSYGQGQGEGRDAGEDRNENKKDK
jgi:hypothetical protein